MNNPYVDHGETSGLSPKERSIFLYEVVGRIAFIDFINEKSAGKIRKIEETPILSKVPYDLTMWTNDAKFVVESKMNYSSSTDVTHWDYILLKKSKYDAIIRAAEERSAQAVYAYVMKDCVYACNLTLLEEDIREGLKFPLQEWNKKEFTFCDQSEKNTTLMVKIPKKHFKQTPHHTSVKEVVAKAIERIKNENPELEISEKDFRHEITQ